MFLAIAIDMVKAKELNAMLSATGTEPTTVGIEAS